MNKYKKIAMAVVSTVMAGAMVFGMTACGNNDGGDGGARVRPGGTPTHPSRTDTDAATLTKGTLSGTDEQEVLPLGTKGADESIRISVGYNNDDTGAQMSAANITTLDGVKLMGKAWAANNLKPAWQALQDKFDVQFDQVWKGKDSQASSNIATLKNEQVGNVKGLATMGFFTASATTINQEAQTSKSASDKNGTLLNISNYLDKMPNYKAFLEANPVVWSSLIADANTGAMYMLPYFDGNDDIEKFVLLRKDLVETLLDGKSGETLSTTTFEDQAKAKNNATTPPLQEVYKTASISSFMGTTGSWEVDVTDPAALDGTPAKGTNKDAVKSDQVTATVKIKIDYDAALADAKASTDGSMGKVLSEVEGVTAEKIAAQTSGNIVDIMNLAINESEGKVTGGQLLRILRQYIKVAYKTAAGASFYTADNGGLKTSDVFNSACAAWDADLYAALGRVFVTCGSMLGDDVKETPLLYLIAGRQYTTQRTTDVSSLAGELYGVRGLESRYNYTYINNKGGLEDGRTKLSFWDAMQRMNDMAAEGLFNTSDNITGDQASHSGSANAGIQTLSLHDYVQTQTAKQGFGTGNYNFAPVLTPVSQWDVDGNGTIDKTKEIFRFTESWRGVKDGGLAISFGYCKANPNKLDAILKIIDFCYSKQGQIMMTYGPQDTTNNSENPNGLWYGTELSQVNKVGGGTIDVSNIPEKAQFDSTASADLKAVVEYVGDYLRVKDEYASQAFAWGDKLYSGTFYNGRQIPTMTDQSLEVFGSKSKNNFTNYARQLLGTCFPAFEKDQGFEFQCTATCGIVGSNIVNIALNNGTIKHQNQAFDDNNYWYTLVPTQLPYNNTQSAAIGGDYAAVSGAGSATNNLYISSSSTYHNILLDIMYYGIGADENIAYVATNTPAFPDSLQKCIDINNALHLSDLVTMKQAAWGNLMAWYDAHK